MIVSSGRRNGSEVIWRRASRSVCGLRVQCAQHEMQRGQHELRRATIVDGPRAGGNWCRHEGEWRKRGDSARPGWDNLVLAEMRERIQERLRAFWDVGLRGPDFVWAATGPALEIYSKHPAVRKANEPGALLDVDEFLKQVRRIVVDFVVGQVLTHKGGPDVVTGLDDVTTYYVLHRYDFGFDEAPSGAAILYALSCDLTDRDLTDRYDLLSWTGGQGDGVTSKYRAGPLGTVSRPGIRSPRVR